MGSIEGVAAADLWCILVPKAGATMKVLAGLEERGLGGYAPMERVWRGIGSRRRVHDRPLIPGYVFARTADRLHQVHEIEGVARLLTIGAGPAFVPDAKVQQLRDDERAGAFDKTKGKGVPLKVNHPVRVRSGPYEGRIGMLVNLSPSRRAKVFLDMVRGGQWSVLIDPALLEAA